MIMLARKCRICYYTKAKRFLVLKDQPIFPFGRMTVPQAWLYFGHCKNKQTNPNTTPFISRNHFAYKEDLSAAQSK